MLSTQFQELYATLRAAPDRSTMSLEDLRAAHEERAKLLPVPADVSVRPVDAGGVPAEWVSAPGAVEGRAIIYSHGGGYYRGSLNTVREMVSRISRAAGVAVLNVGYRLAPEHPFPAAVDDFRAAWRWLLGQGLAPKQVVVGGDSAGGGLAMALLAAERAAGAALPAGAACLSPWVDLTQSGDSYTTRAEEDPSITKAYLDHAAGLYLAGADGHEPLASPLFAELAGLPPLLIQVGTAEVLLDDATRLAAKAEAAGVSVTLQAWEGLTHVWQNNGPSLPEGQDAVEKIGEFVRGALA